ncbi:MAG: CBS domain-containing protein [Deltaproteobacteria bacterium]|nr:CBS domain-containing protein [Deltaproteobacteria bacterium]
MTRSPLSVPIDATVRVAEDLMIDNEVRHLPVTDSEALAGIVSDRDIAFSSNVSESDLADRLRVRDVCSLDVYAVPPDEPLDAVLSKMAERHLGSVVVTEHGKIAGVFTVTDACRYFAEYLRAHFGASREG